MKYLISVILIFLGSTLLNITVHNELMKNIILKISGGLVMFFGVSMLVRAIKMKNVSKKES